MANILFLGDSLTNQGADNFATQIGTEFNSYYGSQTTNSIKHDGLQILQSL